MRESSLEKRSMNKEGLNILKDFAGSLDYETSDRVDPKEVTKIDKELFPTVVSPVTPVKTPVKKKKTVSWADKKKVRSVEKKEFDPVKDQENFDKIIMEANNFYVNVGDMRPEQIKRVSEVRKIYDIHPVNKPSYLSDEKILRIAIAHNNHQGHIKRDKLLKKVNKGVDEIDWITMAEVQEYVRYCGHCQKISTSTPVHRTGYEPSVDTDRLRTYQTDVFEAKPGFYVQTIYNNMTKELQHRIMESPTAKEIVIGLMEFRARGMNIQRVNLREDKGSNQTADEVQTFVQMLNIDVQFGVAGSHQDNSEQERAYEEIRRHLIPICQELAAMYGDEYLEVAIAQAMVIYNTLESNLGVAPWEISRPLDHGDIGDILFQQFPELKYSELKEKMLQIQEFLLERMMEKQDNIFLKREEAKDKAGPPTDSIKEGHLVLFKDENRVNKIAFRKLGPFEIVSLHKSAITRQTMARLRDITGTKEDWLVHPSLLTIYNYDQRIGPAPMFMAALDTKEMIAIKVLSHVTRNPENPEKLLDYDFQVEWANGYINWMPQKEISKLAIYEDYMFDNKELFRPVIARMKEAERKKLNTPLTVFQERRKKVPPNFEFIHAVQPKVYSGNRNSNDYYGITNIGYTSDMYANTRGETYLERLNIIADSFDPEALAEGAREIFIKLMHENPKYQTVFSDLLPGNFVNVDPIHIVMRDVKNFNYQGVRPIRNEFLKKHYVLMRDKLEREGRIRKLPIDAEMPINNCPHMVDESTPTQEKARLTFDARIRNQNTKLIPWTSTRTISDYIEKLKGKYKNTADASQAFFQLAVDEESRKYLRWIDPITGDKYEMLGVDMGGSNSPAYLQNTMDKIFGLHSSYMDDFMFSSDTWQESLDIFKTKIMDKAVEYNVHFNPKKIKLLHKKIEGLGHLVDNNLIYLNEETREKIKKAALPKTSKELMRYVGLINWGRDHINDIDETSAEPPEFAAYIIAKLTPMYKQGPKLTWTPETMQAFTDLKNLAADNNPLHFFDANRPIHMATDACKEGWGAIVFHINPNGSKHIFGIASGTFNVTEKNWTTNEQEAKAILNGLQAFSNYLAGRSFYLFTDHKNLTFIHNASSPKILRWRAELNRYAFTAYHIPGRLNWETDFLSRMQLDDEELIANGTMYHGGVSIPALVNTTETVTETANDSNATVRTARTVQSTFGIRSYV